MRRRGLLGLVAAGLGLAAASAFLNWGRRGRQRRELVRALSQRLHRLYHVLFVDRQRVSTRAGFVDARAARKRNTGSRACSVLSRIRDELVVGGLLQRTCPRPAIAALACLQADNAVQAPVAARSVGGELAAGWVVAWRGGEHHRRASVHRVGAGCDTDTDLGDAGMPAV